MSYRYAAFWGDRRRGRLPVPTAQDHAAANQASKKSCNAECTQSAQRKRIMALRAKEEKTAARSAIYFLLLCETLLKLCDLCVT